MKKLALSAVVALAFLLWGGSAHAITYTCPPYPFIFTNGTIADGTQVNANFNSIAACVNNAPFGSGGGSLRLPLTGTKNLYVATTGLDTGQCTASGSPCLTLAYACNQALLDYDQQGFIIAINVADGTYNASGCTISGPQVGAATSGTTPASIWIIGDVATPDNVVISSSHGPATFIVTGGMNIVLEGMKITSSTGSLIFPAYGAIVDIQFVDLGNTGSVNFGMLHSENFGVVKISGNITLSGTVPGSFIQDCCEAGQTVFIETPITVKIVGTLNMAGGFISLGMNSIAYVNSNFVTFDQSSGSVVGPKYSISSSSTLWTQAGSADSHNTFLPGSLPGVMAENAVYRPSGATYADAKVGLGFLNLFFSGGPLQLWVNASTGSDTTDCQTQAKPCATIQYAVVQALTYYDSMGINISIRVAPGTYTGQVIIHGPLVGASGNNTGAGLFINGTGASPDDVVVSTPGLAFLIDGGGATVNIQNMKIVAGGGGDAIEAERQAQVAITNIDFGAVGGAQLHADSGAHILPFGDYMITGGGTSHFRVTDQGRITCLGSYTVTLSGTLTFNNFALASDLALIDCNSSNVTWTGGTISGNRYFGSGNGVIDTTSGGASYFPGNSPGSLLSGAQYL